MLLTEQTNLLFVLLVLVLFDHLVNGLYQILISSTFHMEACLAIAVVTHYFETFIFHAKSTLCVSLIDLSVLLEIALNALFSVKAHVVNVRIPYQTKWMSPFQL